MIKGLYIFAIVFSSFLVGGFALASHSVDVYQNVDNLYNTGTQNYNHIIQKFKTGHADNGIVTVSMCRSQNGTSLYMYLCDNQGYTTTNGQISCVNSLASVNIFSEYVASVPSCGTPNDYSWDLGYTMSANTEYYLLFKATANNSNAVVKWGYNSDNLYSDGQMAYSNYNYSNGSHTYYTASTSDMYFITYYDPQDAISITAPTDGATIPDFSAWNVLYDTADDTAEYRVKVYYGYNPISLPFFDSTDVATVPTATWVIGKGLALNDGLWWAQAYLYADYVEVASSSVINFTISATSTNDYLAGQTRVILWNNNYDICANVATSTILGGIECALKKVINWTFVPSATTISEFQTAYEDMKDSFPFNTVYGVIDAGLDGLATSTTDMNDTFSMPFIRNTGTTTEYYMMPILSSSSMPATIGEDNTNLFRDTLGFILWIIAGVVIFFTIKITW